MTQISSDRIASIEARQARACRRRCRRGDLAPDEFVRLSKDYAAIEPVAEAAREVRRLRAELEVLTGMLHDPAAEAELKEMAAAEAEEIRHKLPRGRARARASSCCRATRPTSARRCSRCAPAPAATKRRCSRATCCACTSASPKAQGWRFELISASARRSSAATRKRSPRSTARACSRGSSSKAACIASSACRRPKAAGASTPRRRPSRCCPRPRTSTSRSTTRTCASTSIARPGPAASRSTPPTARCASPTCRPAWWSSSRTRSRSTRTRPRR